MEYEERVGDVSEEASVVVTPANTTTYTLMATNGFGSDTELVTIEVVEEILEAALAPTESTCDGVAVGSDCDVFVSLVNTENSYKGLELQFDSSSFGLEVASTTTLTSDCLIGAGTTKVVLPCDSAFTSPGEVAVLNVRRASPAASSFEIHSAFVAVDANMKLAVNGGTLEVSARD